MFLKLYKTPTGEVALIVNNALIIDGEGRDDGARMVEQVGERLAAALQTPLQVVAATPTSAEWGWEDLIGEAAPATECNKCGSPLIDGLCRDSTCPYSDWPQCVSLGDLQNMAGDDIAAKYGLIRAEVHSDDHVFSGRFFAQGWFEVASDEDIVRLAEEGWGLCEEADNVASAHEHQKAVALVFEYIRAKQYLRGAIGFGCTVNEVDALAWLMRQQYGLWARMCCEDHGIRIVEAQEPEVAGRFDWIGPHGNACEVSFESADEAARDAVSVLGINPGVTVSPLYLAYWDQSVFVRSVSERKLVGPGFFCEGRCYDPDDIEGISALAVGRTWCSPDYGCAHTVTRIA